MNLTELEVRAAKPKPKPYKLYDEKGLFLLVKPSGARLWRFKYAYSGVEKLLALGWKIANDSPLAVLDAIPPVDLGDVRALVRRVVASGQAWVAPTLFEGRDVVRICATNGETKMQDVDALIAALNEGPKGPAA